MRFIQITDYSSQSGASGGCITPKKLINLDEIAIINMTPEKKPYGTYAGYYRIQMAGHTNAYVSVCEDDYIRILKAIGHY